MFCKECGTDMGENRFCPNCGAEAKTEAKSEASNEAPVWKESVGQAKESSLKENTAGLLCYILGWLTGIIFLLIDKRPFVKFHAAQSIVTFGAISLFTLVFNRIIYLLPYTIWRILSSIDTLISLGSLVLAIYLMVQAHNGKYFKLPFAGDLAEKLVKKSGSAI